ncbi:hypothetical protein Desdi_3337 [Desulfitobacterium dichloroeliminans LMG P-21439]|uniref:Uncharacterized protein n=1 Tax=Desulfitobacterium dichloroeliminans (strain LMG P-21439 / DCA1) TaxID=871963 RepID=L0FDJ4_DESDL|nr:hypothetical protein Desdi_3337 [Desulfitobacterium dichloroeliminans LMG P-21439]
MSQDYWSDAARILIKVYHLGVLKIFKALRYTYLCTSRLSISLCFKLVGLFGVGETYPSKPSTE